MRLIQINLYFYVFSSMQWTSWKWPTCLQSWTLALTLGMYNLFSLSPTTWAKQSLGSALTSLCCQWTTSRHRWGRIFNVLYVFLISYVDMFEYLEKVWIRSVVGYYQLSDSRWGRGWLDRAWTSAAVRRGLFGGSPAGGASEGPAAWSSAAGGPPTKARQRFHCATREEP